MVEAVATTVSRVTATNPVIRSMLRHQNLLRSPSPLSVGHGNFAKVQQ
jgi:hypothetical protein